MSCLSVPVLSSLNSTQCLHSETNKRWQVARRVFKWNVSHFRKHEPPPARYASALDFNLILNDASSSRQSRSGTFLLKHNVRLKVVVGIKIPKLCLSTNSINIIAKLSCSYWVALIPKALRQIKSDLFEKEDTGSIFVVCIYNRWWVMPNRGKLILSHSTARNSFALIVAALHKCALPEINGVMSLSKKDESNFIWTTEYKL